MYHYEKLGETEVTHSHIIAEDDMEKVIVNFERPTADGFDSARCILPSYHWVSHTGYSEKELALFQYFVESNAYLFYKYARSGGIMREKVKKIKKRICGYLILLGLLCGILGFLMLMGASFEEVKRIFLFITVVLFLAPVGLGYVISSILCYALKLISS